MVSSDRFTNVAGKTDSAIDDVKVETVLASSASLPRYAHFGDAGADLSSTVDLELKPGGGRARVPTGVFVAIPPGYAGFILPRSGLAANFGVTCLNAPGLIDCGYRGELQVVLVNTDPQDSYQVTTGDRIAQLVIQRIEQVVFEQVQQLSPASRAGGFGHTGR